MRIQNTHQIHCMAKAAAQFQRIFSQLTALMLGSMLMRETRPSMNLINNRQDRMVAIHWGAEL